MKLDSKILRRHMCGLKEQGLEDYVQALSDQPRVRCSYCGATANSLRNVCITSFDHQDSAIQSENLVMDSLKPK